MKQAYLQSRLKSKKLPISQNSSEMFSVIRLNIPCKKCVCKGKKCGERLTQRFFFLCFPNVMQALGAVVVGSWWHPQQVWAVGWGTEPPSLGPFGKVCAGCVCVVSV